MPRDGRRLLAWILAVPSLTLFGAVLGGMSARFFTQSDMGYDQIATALGGFGIGALVGLTIVVILGPRLATRTLVLISAAAGLATVVLLTIGYAQSRARRAAREMSQSAGQRRRQEPRASRSGFNALAASFNLSTSTSIPSSRMTTRSPMSSESSLRSRPPLRLDDSTPLCPSKRMVRS